MSPASCLLAFSVMLLSRLGHQKVVPLLKGPCFALYKQLHPVCLIRKAHTKATTTASSLGSLSWPTWPKEVLYVSDTGHLPRVPQAPCLLAFPVMVPSQLNYTSCEKLVPLLKGPCIVIIYIQPCKITTCK